MKMFKAPLIIATILSCLYWFGATFAGGDGFTNNPDEPPVGVDWASFFSIFIIGFLFGLFPLRRVVNKLRNKKD
jgi:hypothetical protein